jgi:hypothetical protein
MIRIMANIIGCAAAFAVLAALGAVQADTYKGVTIAPETSSATYRRSLYKHWTDDDADKMSTRHEVLEEESLRPPRIADHRGKRIVVEGLWVGRYTGLITTDPGKLQIDHMVPLKETHESGGAAWGKEKKRQYSNDLTFPGDLIAVKGGSNGSKGAKDPADWMPPNRAYWCEYLENWLEVKRRWELSMDLTEAEAVKKGLKVCKKYVSGDHLDGRH